MKYPKERKPRWTVEKALQNRRNKLLEFVRSKCSYKAEEDRKFKEEKLDQERETRKEARRAARIAKHGLVWVEHIDSLNQKRLAS